jgi:hypothetical protein
VVRKRQDVEELIRGEALPDWLRGGRGTGGGVSD